MTAKSELINGDSQTLRAMTAFDSELARRSRRQRLQFPDHARNDFERAIDVRLVVEPAEGEPQTAAGLLVNQTHRAQDVRRL